MVERRRRESLPLIALQPLFEGVETAEDRIFWKHYCDRLSSVLTVEGEAKNAFKDIMVPLATKHKGLMHSILALSGKHIDFDTPYGANILKDHETATNRQKLNTRADHHHNAALGAVFADRVGPSPAGGDTNQREEAAVSLNGSYGQMLCFLLQTIAEGNGTGAHRIHLETYQRIVRSDPPTDPTFATFLSEFFQYHTYADELLRPAGKPGLEMGTMKWTPPPTAAHMHTPRLLGVADGLLTHLAQISRIRETIRSNMALHLDPAVDYICLYQAAEVDAAVHGWLPWWPPGDGRAQVTLLYKQAVWIYLFQTIHPPVDTATATTDMATGVRGSGALAQLASAHDSSSVPTTATYTGTSNHQHQHHLHTESIPYLPAPTVNNISASLSHHPTIAATVSPTTTIGRSSSTVATISTSSVLQPPSLRPVSSSSSSSSTSSSCSSSFCSSSSSFPLSPAHSPSSFHMHNHNQQAATSPTATACSSCFSTPKTATSDPLLHPLPQNSGPPAPQQRPSSKSPSPIRVLQVDKRLSDALASALDMLDAFKPSDPGQTLLLIPCLLLGVVCFFPEQREKVRQALKAVRGYTGLRNCERVAELLERVWASMDEGDAMAVWDWQGLAGDNGDFLCS